MIPDYRTDRVYFSDLLPRRYPLVARRLLLLLNQHGVATGCIPGTRDIWCRDYMPIQLDSGRFVQFDYAPDYLRDEYKHLITPPNVARAVLPDHVCESCPIVLDDGNVVRWHDHAIVTDKIYPENPGHGRRKLRTELASRLEVAQLTVIPSEPGDVLGHADGVVRFVDERTVVVNDYRRIDAGYRQRLLACLRRAGLNWIELPCYPVDRGDGDIPPATGVYVNFLQTRGLLAVPVFGLPADEYTIGCLGNLFPEVSIVSVPCQELAREGGALNCISWTILAKVPGWAGCGRPGTMVPGCG